MALVCDTLVVTVTQTLELPFWWGGVAFPNSSMKATCFSSHLALPSSRRL